MAGSAANRRRAHRPVGAPGAIERTAPGRAAPVAQRPERLGVPAGGRRRFDPHAVPGVERSDV